MGVAPPEDGTVVVVVVVVVVDVVVVVFVGSRVTEQQNSPIPGRSAPKIVPPDAYNQAA
jgi:hypothetical protein